MCVPPPLLHTRPPSMTAPPLGGPRGGAWAVPLEAARAEAACGSPCAWALRAASRVAPVTPLTLMLTCVTVVAAVAWAVAAAVRRAWR